MLRAEEVRPSHRADEQRAAGEEEDGLVRAGRVRLQAVNTGRLTHNLTVESFEHEEGEEPHLYGRTDTLHPGQRGSERAPIYLKPGKYRLTCTIGNHDDLGQYGELKVTSAKGS